MVCLGGWEGGSNGGLSVFDLYKIIGLLGCFSFIDFLLLEM